MTYVFTSSSTSEVGKQILIALAGTTGSGKTESALRIARGIVGEKGKLCVIDTEHRRALNKAGRYEFDHLDLQPPFSPDNFKNALEAAIKAGYGAIVIDNFSLEWAGEGGCLDMQEEALKKMSGGDFNKAKSLTALAWSGPKQKHKQLMYAILRCPIPLIFCLRAEPKIKFEKVDGKNTFVDAGWLPITEKMFGYEMLVYALLMPENPGAPVHLKQLEPELASVLPMGKQITEQAGKLLAEWAAGGKAKKEDKKESIETRRGKMLTYLFERWGVTEAQILNRVEKLEIKTVGEYELTVLRQCVKDIEAGTAVETVFPLAESAPEVSENVSEVNAESEGENVQKQLIHKLEERVFEVGELQLSNGQRKRYGNRANLRTEDLQALLDELG